jgi:colanic acid biosynthesis glycosyl transferase WcaI
VCWHVQDLQVDAALELGMLPKRLAGILKWLERAILSRVDLVTTVSAAMGRRLTAKGPTRQPVVQFPNWADVSTMRPWSGDNRFRQAWGVSPDLPVVMYSGNLGKKQGIDVLLEAATKLKTPHLLVIAGEGAERADLEHKAAALGLMHIRFVSLVPAERLAEFLSAGDVHCIPQRRAAAGLVMPSKLLNLMAVARPVVVTAPAQSDLADVVTRSHCGLAVEPEVPHLLAEGLDRLLADVSLRQRCGAAGRTFVETTYAADPILGSFAQRLTALIRSRHHV